MIRKREDIVLPTCPHQYDVERIVAACSMYGYEADLLDCYEIWNTYSTLNASAWIDVPDTHEEMWEIIGNRIEDMSRPKNVYKKEFIICSAVDYNDIIVCGRRHGDCNDTIRNLAFVFSIPDRDKQGFMTSAGRFVSRKEAFKIAKENNQIWHTLHDGLDDKELTSEDLFFHNEDEDDSGNW